MQIPIIFEYIYKPLSITKLALRGTITLFTYFQIRTNQRLKNLIFCFRNLIFCPKYLMLECKNFED